MESLSATEDKMKKSLEAFQQEIMNIRTGRAATSLLDNIEVEVYGSNMKLNQLATVNAPEARLLTIQPWDKGQIQAIEKAILESPLDLNPANDGTIIRIPMPELSEERRREYVKVIVSWQKMLVSLYAIFDVTKWTLLRRNKKKAIFLRTMRTR